MRNLKHLDPYRYPLMGHWGNSYNGAFKLKINGERYTVIASNGEGWEHVSISHHQMVPSWDTMNQLKDLFFEEHEAVMQLHPPKNNYINNHPNCLHLWIPVDQVLPVPPYWLVGMKG